MSIRLAVIAIALLPWAHSADAHGIAGNRFFVGTLTFDDPAVADEAVLPAYSSLDHPAEGGNVVDNRINWSFVRLLTPTLQVSIDSGWIHRSWPAAQASGFDATDTRAMLRSLRQRTVRRSALPGRLDGLSVCDERRTVLSRGEGAPNRPRCETLPPFAA
jgi:hypothetical protein